jgi:hypothetical protein
VGKNDRTYEVEIRYLGELDEQPSLDELRYLVDFLPEIYRDFVELMQED